jgi:class 3 adenylate cyclase
VYADTVAGYIAMENTTVEEAVAAVDTVAATGVDIERGVVVMYIGTAIVIVADTDIDITAIASVIDAGDAIGVVRPQHDDKDQLKEPSMENPIDDFGTNFNKLLIKKKVLKLK